MDRAARRILRGFLEAEIRTGEGGLSPSRVVGVLDQFAEYLGLLRRAGRAMNLIGPLDDQAVVEQLFCDSLTPCALDIDLGTSILDVGSGAGIPGIPLALVDDRWTVALLEPRDRRYRFLGMATRALKLAHVSRTRGRIERAADLEALGLPVPDTVVSKAVFAPDDWVELGATLVRPGGTVIVLAAADDVDATRRRAGELDGSGLRLTEIGGREFRWPGAVPRWCLAFRTAA